MLLFKAHLAAHVALVIARRGWTQSEAAKQLGVDQPRISHLVRGRLSEFSVDSLLGYLKRLDVKMSVSIEDPADASSETVLLTV
jgi:predicted XRE-type DNA-binding protein